MRTQSFTDLPPVFVRATLYHAGEWL